MHDFIQSLSFQSQGSPTRTQLTLDALRGVMRSFDDDGPTYRPSPRDAKRTAKHRSNRKLLRLTHNS